jgi:hypothetical protein
MTTTPHRYCRLGQHFVLEPEFVSDGTGDMTIGLSYVWWVTVCRERRAALDHVVVENRARMAWSSAASQLVWSTPSGAAERSAHGRSIWCRLPM